MAIATALLLLLLASPAVHAATQHTVGGSGGWTLGGDFSTGNEVFTVGDSLVFNYDSSTHSVAEVSKSDYSSCSSSNAIKTYTDGSTTIPLTKTGPMYFLCPTGGHCAGGMKLQIDVVAASTSPSTTPATPTTPSTPSSTPGTPSTTPAPSTPNSSPATPTPAAPNGSGAASSLANVNIFVFGSLLVFGSVIGLMG